MELQEIDPAFSSDLNQIEPSTLSLNDSHKTAHSHPFQHEHEHEHGHDHNEHDQLAEEEQEEEHGRALSSRRGEGGAGGGGSKRYSLAFELASATPEPSSKRDLLRDLGIDEDEDEDAEGEQDYARSDTDAENDDEDEGEGDRDPDAQFLGNNLSGEATNGSIQHRSTTPPPSSSHHPSTPLSVRAPNARASSLSLASSYFAPSPQPDSSSPPSKSKQEDEEEAIESTLAQTCSLLANSLESTSVFLAHLRAHTSPTAATDLVASPASNVDETDGTKAVVVEDNEQYVDRQPVIESMASTLLQTLYEVSKTREEQLHELSALEKEATQNFRLGKIDVDAVPPSPTSPSSTSPSPLLSSLSSLRSTTSTLITTLSSLSEQAQMQKIATTDSGRKLRALRGNVAILHEEILSGERSEGIIRIWEEKEREEEKAGRKREGGFYRNRAREVMQEVEERLEKGWEEARRVLAVAVA